jgi:hypothetical protein
MVTVCAWCQRYMGSREPLDRPELTHGICDDCRQREQHPPGGVLLVVSREREGQVGLLRSMLRPGASVVLDRRTAERRQRSARPRDATADRRAEDRRRTACLYVV